MARCGKSFTEADVAAYKQNLLDTFIRQFRPTSTIEVIEAFAGLKAPLDAGLITEAEMDAIRPRFAERIDLKGILANDSIDEALLAHLNVWVGEKLIDEAACDHYKKQVLRKIH